MLTHQLSGYNWKRGTRVCQIHLCLCSLPGTIDQLAYVSPHEYRFDEKARSVVCTVSSDCTVRAWDLQEVSCSLGRDVWADALNAGQVPHFADETSELCLRLSPVGQTDNKHSQGTLET